MNIERKSSCQNEREMEISIQFFRGTPTKISLRKECIPYRSASNLIKRQRNLNQRCDLFAKSNKDEQHRREINTKLEFCAVNLMYLILLVNPGRSDNSQIWTLTGVSMTECWRNFDGLLDDEGLRQPMFWRWER